MSLLDYVSLAPNELITLLWVIFSFTAVVLSAIACIPARQETKDSDQDVRDLGPRLNGAKILGEQWARTTRMLYKSQLTFVFVQLLFLSGGLVAWKIPPEDTPQMLARAFLIPACLLCAQVGIVVIQYWLLKNTLDLRKTRHLWVQFFLRQSARPHKRKLGDILIDAGLVSRDQIRDALARQEKETNDESTG